MLLSRDGTSGFRPADLTLSERDFSIQRENIISKVIPAR